MRIRNLSLNMERARWRYMNKIDDLLTSITVLVSGGQSHQTGEQQQLHSDLEEWTWKLIFVTLEDKNK